MDRPGCLQTEGGCVYECRHCTTGTSLLDKGVRQAWPVFLRGCSTKARRLGFGSRGCLCVILSKRSIVSGTRIRSRGCLCVILRKWDIVFEAQLLPLLLLSDKGVPFDSLCQRALKKRYLCSSFTRTTEHAERARVANANVFYLFLALYVIATTGDVK